MVVVREGVISKQVGALQDTLAKSLRFQTLNGTIGDEAATKEKIVNMLTGSVARPRILIGIGRGWRSVPHSTTGWETSGPLQAIFEFDTNSNLNDNEKIIEFLNNVGTIMDDVMDMHTAMTPGTIDVSALAPRPDQTDFEVEEDPDDDTATEYIYGVVEFEVSSDR